MILSMMLESLRSKYKIDFQLKAHHDSANAPNTGFLTLCAAVLTVEDRYSLSDSSMSRPF
ncbi:hypothetical protein BK308_30800 [Escherichia coli]|nr:hypothetical protein BK308_30800 [Escherichia coli]